MGTLHTFAMFLGVGTALMLTTMNVNLMSWLGFTFRDVGATDEAGGRWTLKRKGLGCLFHLLLRGVRVAGGMWGPWQAQPVIWGENPGLRRGSGRGSGAGRLGARWKARRVAVAASTWPPSPGAPIPASTLCCVGAGSLVFVFSSFSYC